MDIIPLYLSLGSNVGDRQSNIRTALELLDEAFPGGRDAISEIMEFPSWGFDSDDFLNCVVRYRIPAAGQSPLLHALHVLSVCKDIERRMGRQEDLRFDDDGNRIYSSRIIDIDIIFYGAASFSCDRLTVPHKLAGQRDFVMIPLLQVAENDVIDSFPEIFHSK